MSQYAYAKALNLLSDIGVDAEDARWFMKRLHDLGYAVHERDPAGGGTSPPAHPAKAARGERRQSYLSQMRAEVEAARLEKEAERQAALAAEKERREAEDAARERQLRVAEVLAAME